MLVDDLALDVVFLNGFLGYSFDGDKGVAQEVQPCVDLAELAETYLFDDLDVVELELGGGDRGVEVLDLGEDGRVGFDDEQGAAVVGFDTMGEWFLLDKQVLFDNLSRFVFFIHSR